MINYFNFERFDNDYLLTNDLGFHVFLSDSDFRNLISKNIKSIKEETLLELEDKFFISNKDKEVFLQDILQYSRSSKSYVFSATQLFIFVITKHCNANCIYCQASSPKTHNQSTMSIKTADKALDIVLSAPSDDLIIEFQGGEPLLNFALIQYLVIEGKKRAQKRNKHLSFSLVSNLSLLSDEIVDFLQINEISVSTSLDGCETIHNQNRPIEAKNSYQCTINGIKRLQSKEFLVGAIETTTKQCFPYYKELIETYIRCDLNSIFIRPLTPLGIAQKKWSQIGYSAEEFVQFYNKTLDYIIDLNIQGKFFLENNARLFLRKILHNEAENYMELRSPCGATIGQIAFNYNGEVYTCDEGRMLAEMGDASFRIGTINDSYDSLVNHSVCKSVAVSSVLESLPSCHNCVYMPYCGTCPVVNYAMYGDIFERQPNNYKCLITKGMLKKIFELLKENNNEKNKILRSWISNTE